MITKITGRKPELVMLIGLPACGKSTYAKSLSGYEIVSSDAIREELFGDASVQKNPAAVFDLAGSRIKDALGNGGDVIFDATNLDRKRRMALINNSLSEVRCTKRCVLFAVPVERCRERNAKRKLRVPDSTYGKMLRSFHVPLLNEGWDEIEIRWHEEKADISFMDEAMLKGFDQETKWHGLSLGSHMERAEEYAAAHGASRATAYAAGIHDIGKVFTKKHEDAHGMYSPNAHYYGHENYGAYLALVLGGDDLQEENPRFSPEEWYKIAVLVNWHMAPLNRWNTNKKAKRRDARLLGNDLYKDVLLIHEADVSAH